MNYSLFGQGAPIDGQLRTNAGLTPVSTSPPNRPISEASCSSPRLTRFESPERALVISQASLVVVSTTGR